MSDAPAAQHRGTEADVHSPTPVVLPEGIRRRSVRPLQYRDAGFDAAYDDSTLFYDATWTDIGVLLAGPPLRNLTPALDGMRVVARPSGRECDYRVRSLHLHSQVWVNAPEGTDALTLRVAWGEIEVPVAPARTGAFRGRRVLYTMLKDDDLTWVADWVRFHRDVHGADAVLVYDNDSTAYSSAQLLTTLQSIAGIESAQVTRWPFKYGPQGFQSLGFWDSAYAQPGAFEHARWSALSGARAVMNGDVDELVVSRGGERLFDAVERSRAGVLRYPGYWVTTTDLTEPPVGTTPRHRDFAHHVRVEVDWHNRPPRRTFSAPKWTVVPARCPGAAQWFVHRIHGWPRAAVTTPRFRYRHFRRLSTGWKYDRSDVEAFDPARHVHDDALVRDYARVDWGC